VKGFVPDTSYHDPQGGLRVAAMREGSNRDRLIRRAYSWGKAGRCRGRRTRGPYIWVSE